MNDRRSCSLHVSPAGRTVLAALERFVPHREAELLTDLSEEERSMLLDLDKRGCIAAIS